MNERVADTMAKHLAHLPFLTKVAGCVQEVKIDVKNGKPKRVPVARVIYTNSEDFDGRINVDENAVITPKYCEKINDYQDLIPNSNETGIAYFEDLGARRTGGSSRHDEFTGSMLLVVWLNFKKIGNDYQTADLCGALLSALPSHIKDTPYLHGGTLKVDGIMPKRPSPFERYSYNETEKQYLTYPYDYFALKFTYTARVAKGCGTNIILNPSQC